MAIAWHKIHKKQKRLRKLVLAVLERLNPGDIRIRHHYTGWPLKLHSFKHKGYWYHGRRREQAEMEFFGRVISPGDTAIEVGGHIGYISMDFLDLVGPKGKVIVFEPGQNNLTNERGQVFDLLSQLGDVIFNPQGRVLNEDKEVWCDICALHPEKHLELVKPLDWNFLGDE